MPIYEHCLVRKIIRKPFGKAIRAKFLLQLIHSNICGPMSVKIRWGTSYFITFIDDFTHYGHVYLISHKSDALEYFRLYMNEIENQLEKKIKTLRIDQGHEYLFG